MTTADVAAAGPEKQRFNLAPLQKFGRSLMLPIAALPVAALMLRLGQPDLLGRDGLGWEKVAAVVGAGGGALFANLPLLFAVGVAIGVAKKADGSTALAAVVGYLVFKGVGDAVSPFILPAPKPGEDQDLVNYGVLGGILCGLIAAVLWQRYYRISLPPYLAFFGGRRFVPIVTGFATLVLAVLLAIIYPAFDAVLTGLGEWVAANSIVGGFIYGTANRLLIPLGLHHILNSVPWFVLGEYTPAGGDTVQGDIARFLKGDPTAGAFMTGFFPIMMFALPAAALAIYQEAKPKAKKAVGGLMASVALTAFPHRGDRAHRVRLHVRRLAAVRRARRAHRHVDGAGERLGDPGRVRLQCGAVRLPAQLEHRHETGPAHRHGVGVRGGLLRAVPLRHPPVEPAHARP